MSNYVNTGTLITDASTASTACRGWATMSAHLDSGVGTLTWEFKGPDGVWRIIYGGSDNITSQAYTAAHMVNAFFGTDVRVRATGSAGTNPVWDWQVMSSPDNRGD
jgi:hypothetical protein